MLLPTVQALVKIEWEQLRARRALPCMVAIVAYAWRAGLLADHSGAGMVAAGGAMTVGFGSFQWLGRVPGRADALGHGRDGRSRRCSGSLVGHSGPGAVINAAVAGFGAGILLALGPGASWNRAAVRHRGVGGERISGWAGRSPFPARGSSWRAARLQTLIVLATWRWRQLTRRSRPEDRWSFEGDFSRRSRRSGPT